MFSQSYGYERFMGRWSRRLAPLFLRFAGLADAERVLDVGSGTGALTLEVASRTWRSEIVGLDLSPEYIDYARSLTSSPRVSLVVGDAQRLPFPDEYFDRSLSMLVLNFVPDPRKAVAEMRRVTKPGGWIAAAVWDYGRGMTMLRMFWDAVVALDAAAEPRDEKHMPYCRQGELARLWAEAGLRNVEEDALVLALDFDSFDDFWLPFLEGQGPAGAYVAGLPEHRKAALMNLLRRRVVGERGNNGFSLAARAWVVRGQVPR